MCGALGDDEPKYQAVAEAAEKMLTDIDAKTHEVRQAEDVLTRARAVERARRMRAAESYDQLRRDLAAEARLLVPALLRVAPSSLRRAGITRAAALVAQAAENLRHAETPEAIRTEHLPILEQELTRLKDADRAEDQVRASFSALRAAVLLFKARLETDRSAQYADLVKIAGSRALADEFFLSAYTRGDALEDGAATEEDRTGGPA